MLRVKETRLSILRERLCVITALSALSAALTASFCTFSIPLAVCMFMHTITLGHQAFFANSTWLDALVMRNQVEQLCEIGFLVEIMSQIFEFHPSCFLRLSNYVAFNSLTFHIYKIIQAQPLIVRHDMEESFERIFPDEVSRVEPKEQVDVKKHKKKKKHAHSHSPPLVLPPPSPTITIPEYWKRDIVLPRKRRGIDIMELD